ncbi:MAG: DUF2238 domain-containing protein [Ruminococcus sp.]|nr:DUF2238 domain-containing protein [Ruminococcus sp.]
MKTKNDKKYRILASLITLIITIICAILTVILPIETTSVKIIGSIAAVFAISAAAWKFPLYFYISALVFDFFAAILGSVINLYKSIGFYDRFVHYLSGILLARAGILIAEYMFNKHGIKQAAEIKLAFAFFFSSACAGFWEIYEFTADTLLKIDMQGGNSNTMGDIVSGTLGALTYTVIGIIIKRSKNKNKSF